MEKITVGQWISKNILSLIIIVGFVIFGIVTCNRGGFNGNKPSSDTVYSTKTEYIQQPPVYIPQYVPIQSGSQAPIVIPPQYQPSQDLTTLIKQYNELANKFLSQNTYKDSIQLKDTAGRRVGVVNLEDMVSENQIKSRKPSYQLTFPTTTNTITITNYAPNKAKFYVGAHVEGGQKNLLNQAGLGVAYNSKKDALWMVNASYDFHQKGMYYGLSRYWKISLRK